MLLLDGISPSEVSWRQFMKAISSKIEEFHIVCPTQKLLGFTIKSWSNDLQLVKKKLCLHRNRNNMASGSIWNIVWKVRFTHLRFKHVQNPSRSIHHTDWVKTGYPYNHQPGNWTLTCRQILIISQQILKGWPDPKQLTPGRLRLYIYTDTYLPLLHVFYR